MENMTKNPYFDNFRNIKNILYANKIEYLEPPAPSKNYDVYLCNN